MRIFTAIAALALASCGAEETLAPADYDPPSNYYAKAAFLEALRIDGYENVDVGEEPDSVNAVNYQASAAYNDRVLTRQHTQTALKAFRKIELGACEWRKSAKSDVPSWARKRVTAPPSAVYHCAYKVSFQINPPKGNKYELDGEGDFFKQDGKIAYMGKIPNPYH